MWSLIPEGISSPRRAMRDQLWQRRTTANGIWNLDKHWDGDFVGSSKAPPDGNHRAFLVVFWGAGGRNFPLYNFFKYQKKSRLIFSPIWGEFSPKYLKACFSLHGSFVPLTNQNNPSCYTYVINVTKGFFQVAWCRIFWGSDGPVEITMVGIHDMITQGYQLLPSSTTVLEFCLTHLRKLTSIPTIHFKCKLSVSGRVYNRYMKAHDASTFHATCMTLCTLRWLSV